MDELKYFEYEYFHVYDHLIIHCYRPYSQGSHLPLLDPELES